MCPDEKEENEIKTGKFPLSKALQPQESTSLDQTFDIPKPDYQAKDTQFPNAQIQFTNPQKRPNQGEDFSPLE